jgi:phenylpropionate dioxygenase-like ring-hydroxylating dioxygenase large terminal subunit
MTPQSAPSLAAPGAATTPEGPRRVLIAGEPHVVVMIDGQELVAPDRCPHRGAPLSAGTVEDGCLVCPYHGWRFGPDGALTEVPALGTGRPVPARARLGRSGVRSDRNLELTNTHSGLRAGWHPVCRSEEVAAGSRVSVGLLGDELVVQRDPDGGLSAPVAGCVDHLGHVWVAPDPPATGLLAVPDLAEDGWHRVPMPRIEGRYGVGLLLDNQLDAGHFSFVHRNTFGSPEEAAIPPYTVERDGLGFEARLRVPISARNDEAAVDGGHPIRQYRSMTYRYRAPAALWLRLDYEELGGSTGILFCFTPVGAETARMDVDLYFRHPDGFTDEELARRLAFEIQVVGEDMALQDRFDDLALPLEVTAEIHTRVDKAAVEMRRILRELVEGLPAALRPTPI